jgi:hypothetical protein
VYDWKRSDENVGTGRFSMYERKSHIGSLEAGGEGATRYLPEILSPPLGSEGQP